MTRTVTLSACELLLADMIAAQRQIFDTGRGYHDRFQAKTQSSADANARGSRAEVAFCKLHNLYPDVGWNGAAPYDAKTADGCTVDVKCPAHPGWLNVPLHIRDRSHADVFAVMYADSTDATGATFQYAGWQYADVAMTEDWKTQGLSLIHI